MSTGPERSEQVARMTRAAREAALVLARCRGDWSVPEVQRALSGVRGAMRNATPAERDAAMRNARS